MSAYCAAKAGLSMLTQVAALEWASRGIRVNAVAPGPVWTPLNPSDAGESPEQVAKFGSDVPMGRPAQPEELAPAYVFLASDADSSYITGEVLNVMGGETTAG
jgi:NAD(P)-dependent dehydrogenase (short-subunit alcohol dehydrogenase family)